MGIALAKQTFLTGARNRLRELGVAVRQSLGWADDDLVREQFSSLRPLVPTMYLAVFINVLFLAYVAERFSGPQAFVLPSLVGVLIALRLWVWRFTMRRAQTPSVAAMRRSMRGTVAVATVTALGLNLWSLRILGQGDVTERAYLALFTALCTISCAACLSSLPAAAYVVVAVGTVPISVALMTSGDTVLWAMGANLLLISPLLIGMVHRQHGQLRRMVATTSEVAAERSRAELLAYRDPLTGLTNRRAFLDALRAASAGPEHATLAVGMIDLDGFKLINDTYGHATGDALLVEAARRFDALRLGKSVIARLGGDEFAVLMRDVLLVEDARLRLAGVARAFHAPFAVGVHDFRMTASIGMAHSGSDATTTIELLNRADLAMYVAKRRGDGAICLFEPDMEATVRRRVMIEQALAVHAENELIDLVYQPVVETATGRIVAFEALARWTHPLLGVISPDEFVPLAEQAGMTAPMTRFLLSKALRAAATWPPEVGLSFNLSAGELSSAGLAERLLAIVAAEGFEPRRLAFEVTETALMADFAAARQVIGELRAGGVRLLLDDFGAGYASIGYLREISFDGIKLDGSLIATLAARPAAHDLLGGVLQLCRAIGAPVTAEMVETEAQFALLKGLGVACVQGHYLSPPLDAAAALAACGVAMPRGQRAVGAVRQIRRGMA